MHLIERTDCLAELNEIYRQWRAGALSNAEYKIAFAQIDAAHSHDTLCDNGDHRRADRIVSGKRLCSVCALKDYQASNPPRLADDVPGYLLSLPQQVPQ